MVQSVRFVAGLGVAHLPYHLTAERVQHVKRLAAVLPEDTADAVLIHEPRLVRHDDVALWGQGRSYAAFHAAPKAAHAPLSSVFLSSLSSPSASLPVTRRVPLLTIGCDDTAITLQKIRSFYVAVYCLDFLAELCQYGGVVFQEV